MKNSMLIAAGPILAALLSLITLPLVAWFYSSEDVGRFSILQVALGLGLTIFSLQMHQSYVREYYSLSKKEPLLILSLIPGFITFLLCIVIVLSFDFPLSKLIFNIESKTVSISFLISLFSILLINGYVHVVRMRGDALAFSTMQALPKLLVLLFILSSSYFTIGGQFDGLSVINALTYFLSFLFFSWMIRDEIKRELSFDFNIKLMKNMLVFSFPLLISGLAYWGLSASDRFFIKELSGLNELAIYSMATSISSSVFVVSTVFSTIWHPTIYKWIEEGLDVKKTQPIVELVYLLVALIWSFFGVTAWILKYFLPKEYHSVEYIVVGCIAAPLFYMLSETTGFGISVMRKTSYSMLASISALIISVICNYVLIPILGAEGAALSSMISFFVFFVVKTESTAYFLFSFPRLKIYSMLVMYIGMSTCVLFLKEDAHFLVVYLSWLFLATLSLLIFRQRLKDLMSMLLSFKKV